MSAQSTPALSPLELMRRAALLRRHLEPDKTRRACANLVAPVDEAELTATRQALDQRGLIPWLPDRPDFITGQSNGRDAKLPAVLLVAGTPPPCPAIALVGARACDDYGLAVTRRLARDAAELGAAVVSGGAEGVDATAHRAALDAGGRTVVVFAGGHDVPYPAAHRPLFADVAATGGSIVSAYWPTVRPKKHRFLARNRIIAALSDVVIVTRARVKSGSLSTAKHAHALGRRLLAVPGNVGEGLSGGPHRLLASGTARAIGWRPDLANALADVGVLLSPTETQSTHWPVRHCGDPDPFEKNSVAGGDEPTLELDLDDDAHKVKNAISGQTGLDLDTIAMRTGLATSVVVASLALLELTGDIENLPGSRYRASLPTPSSTR